MSKYSLLALVLIIPAFASAQTPPPPSTPNNCGQQIRDSIQAERTARDNLRKDQKTKIDAIRASNESPAQKQADIKSLRDKHRADLQQIHAQYMAQRQACMGQRKPPTPPTTPATH